MAANARTLALVPRSSTSSGERVEVCRLIEDKPILIGRSSESDWRIPDDTVSRRHARLTKAGSQWRITDLSSRHGTVVDGVELRAGESIEIAPGSTIQLGAWMFRCEDPQSAIRSMATVDLRTPTENDRIRQPKLADLDSRRLDVVINASRELASATSIEQIAHVVASSTAAALGRFDAYVINWRDTAEADIIASSAGDSTVMLSQSLLRAASSGNTVSLEDLDSFDRGTSLISLDIHSAICAPLRRSDQQATCLYLDARGSQSPLPPDAATVVNLMARLGGMAVERLSALETARWRESLERELSAARRAQSLLLPERSGTISGCPYTFESKAGRYLAGDLFTILKAPDESVCFALGDVSGKGPEAAIMMVATQTLLRESLGNGSTLDDAVHAVNRHLCEISDDAKFSTLLAGRWVPSTRTLELIDAGHGIYLIRDTSGRRTVDESLRGLPLGVYDTEKYHKLQVELEPAARIIVFTDGVIEQVGHEGTPFGINACWPAIADAASANEDVHRLMNALLAHGGEMLSDDVTIASLELA